MSRVSFISALLALTMASAAAAQSGEPNLAEIARQAEAAKGTIPKAKKSYSNADLSAAGLPPEPAMPSRGFMSTSLGKPVSAEEMLKLSEAKAAAEVRKNQPQEYWVGQANIIRRSVEKVMPRLAELKGRQKNPNAQLQKRAEQEVASIQSQLENAKARWARLEEAARVAKINMGWVSPPPPFPQ
jgi:DNA repair exonuclease SbcCD ATPase subunit